MDNAAITERPMCVLIASDSEAVASVIEDFVLHESRDCAAVHVFPLQKAVDGAVQYRPDILLVVFSEKNPELGVKIITEVQESLPTRILVVGSTTDSKLILRTLRSGARQFIGQDEIENELPAALRQIRNEPPLAEHDGQVITVLGVSGGSGASTLAANIAIGLAQKHRQCALIDLKLESGDLSTLLDLHPAHTLADFCANVERMDQSMFEHCLTPHPSGVHLLAPPWSHHEVGRVHARGIRKALAMCRNTFPYVVVDLDNRYRREHAEALFQSTYILLVMRLDFAALRQARRTIDYLHELRIDADRLRLVINRHGRPKELKVSDVEQSLGINVLQLIPDDSRTVNRANNKGNPVVLEKPRAEVARCFLGIAASVNGKRQQ